MLARESTSASRIIFLYYLATGLFLLLDLAAGINIRLAFLEHYPAMRIAYYGFCFLCLGIVVAKPSWSEITATLESLVTLIGLIVTMASRALIVTDEMLATGEGFVTFQEIMNFLISGSFAYFSWSRGMTRLFGPREV